MDDSSKDLFSSRWGFILAAAGSAIGMGSIWLFPYRAGELGGAAFLIAYVICVFVLGLIAVIGEITFGRLTGKGPVGAFKKALRLSGGHNKAGELIGWIPVIVIFIIALGYTVIVAWVLRFLAGSFTGSAFSATNSVTYFKLITGNGIAVWIVSTLFIVGIAMLGGIEKGIEKVNKFMMPVFFILFLFLVIRVAFLPGAIHGYKFMFIPKLDMLINSKTWILALGQSFYSLSIMGSILIVYGSYARKSEDIVYSAKSVAILSTFAALFASLIIIPAIFSFGKDLNSGPSLMFITIPDIFKTIPLGQLCMLIFFIAVFFAAITSLISIIEVVVESLQNKFKISRLSAVGVSTFMSAVLSILADGHIDGLMDILQIHLVPLCALITGIFVFWILPPRRIIKEIQGGRSKMIGKWIIPVGRYVFCGLVILIYVSNLINLSNG
ncbi:MAG: sodium-dependent transporter [Endomicrobium sp.]|jgi:NSS family neurotransmitter:Na+ symporter|nr:sodium-dependent transporter [Endomicrobium sp.]